MYISIENDQNSDNSLSVTKACKSLGVGRSGYNVWQKRKQSLNLSNSYVMKLKDEIQKIVVEFTGYGYRRVAKELHRRGYKVNHKRVLNLMRQDNLLCIKRKFRPVTTNSNHNFRIYPNLAKDMTVIDINQLWVADITYIHLVKEFIYLAVIMDVGSRRCIGWELDRNIDTQLTLNAFNNALNLRKNFNLNDLVHHSDQGVQYAANAYIDRLKENGIQISMSRKGNPYDNAFAESLIKTLKYEEVYLSEYDAFSDAYQNIGEFIEEVYNKKRLHSSIGYLPPNEFEAQINLNRVS